MLRIPDSLLCIHLCHKLSKGDHVSHKSTLKLSVKCNDAKHSNAMHVCTVTRVVCACSRLPVSTNGLPKTTETAVETRVPPPRSPRNQEYNPPPIINYNHFLPKHLSPTFFFHSCFLSKLEQPFLSSKSVSRDKKQPCVFYLHSPPLPRKPKMRHPTGDN